MNSFVNSLTAVLDKIDTFVWGPVMLILLVGTGIFLTIRTKALCWRNLPYALKSVLLKFPGKIKSVISWRSRRSK